MACLEIASGGTDWRASETAICFVSDRASTSIGIGDEGETWIWNGVSSVTLTFCAATGIWSAYALYAKAIVISSTTSTVAILTLTSSVVSET